MKNSFIAFLYIVLLASTAVWALPHLQRRKPQHSSQSHGNSNPSQSHGNSNPSQSHGNSNPSQSHGTSNPSQSHGNSKPQPSISLTPSTSQGEASHHDTPVNITSPKSGQCFLATSDVTISWTTSLSNEQVQVRILSFDTPTFSLGTDSKNVVDITAKTFTIKIKDWPIGSYLAMVSLVSDPEQYGTSGRFYVCNSTMLPPISSDDSE